MYKCIKSKSTSVSSLQAFIPGNVHRTFQIGIKASKRGKLLVFLRRNPCVYGYGLTLL